ncbi:quinolinate synthase NadA [Alcaligenaceae bacterium 429]|uniref:quinolinate synthase NadA n=1 Tax=Paenalcaligenes sp. Me52 TaxID=3392038 RepID=UPI001092F24F|nr:quinolinate synthase NadA [Alcaligenaceae bacterium 429]
MESLKEIYFDLPDATSGSVRLATAWANVPEPIADTDVETYKNQIREQLKAQDATLVAHYYVDPVIQDLAEETGGCVADSLEMARFGRDCDSSTLLVAGVRFMGESAKILSPQKRVLMADMQATCSLDLGCEISAFEAFCDQHPDREVVVYANTSAAVKARADWVVTSAVGQEIVLHLHQQGKKILWAPDRHLGSYIQHTTGADMVLWQGSCLVHDEFQADELLVMKKRYPEACVLAHPEAPANVLEHADFIGSTSQILAAAARFPNTLFIVATDQRLQHKLKQLLPHKKFMPAPTGGVGATCKSCAFCPWMSLNNLPALLGSLTGNQNEIQVEESIRFAAEKSLKRMLDFSADTALRKQLQQVLQAA